MRPRQVTRSPNSEARPSAASDWGQRGTKTWIGRRSNYSAGETCSVKGLIPTWAPQRPYIIYIETLVQTLSLILVALVALT